MDQALTKHYGFTDEEIDFEWEGELKNLLMKRFEWEES